MRWAICFSFVLFLTACRSTAPVGSQEPEAEITARVIFVIHGDANYLYHDATGRALKADEEAVRRAQAVASQLPNGEVFIFHQRRKRRVLGLFPRPDGVVYRYRNGVLRERDTYRRDPKQGAFYAEALLFESLARTEEDIRRVFLYYGHEIPETREPGYHRSHAKHRFGIESLTGGLQHFARKPFDLVVLSTCKNGRPSSIAELAPLAHYVLASPENLHLSHIDPDALIGLESPGYEPETFAHTFARSAFEALVARTRTVVALSVYDTQHIDPSTLSCEKLPSGSGVEVFYRPPQFGRNRTRRTHSGWTCL